jgi:UDP-N-acetylmuramyl pentapeptide phosphotransferase/UDP-N-acetylglucosamine-1-phosphate transferase
VSDAVQRWLRLQDSILRLHPDTEYPPDRQTTGRILSGWALVAIASIALLVWNGTVADIAAGDPFAIVGSMLGIVLGALIIRESTPGLDELRDELRT